MKLTISNIAWTDADDDEVLTLLPSLEVNAVELAPTRIWLEWEFSESEVAAYRDFCRRKGWCVLRCRQLCIKSPT